MSDRVSKEGDWFRSYMSIEWISHFNKQLRHCSIVIFQLWHAVQEQTVFMPAVHPSWTLQFSFCLLLILLFDWWFVFLEYCITYVFISRLIRIYSCLALDDLLPLNVRFMLCIYGGLSGHPDIGGTTAASGRADADDVEGCIRKSSVFISSIMVPSSCKNGWIVVL